VHTASVVEDDTGTLGDRIHTATLEELNA
jgi:hypothetical protein